MHMYGSDAADETHMHAHLPCGSAGFEDGLEYAAGMMHVHTHLPCGLSEYRSLQRKGVMSEALGTSQ